MTECNVHFHFDKHLRIVVDNKELSGLLLMHAVRGDTIEMMVEASVTNSIRCPDPINGTLSCGKPPNPCPDTMCPYLVKLRFTEEIMDGVRECAERP